MIADETPLIAINACLIDIAPHQTSSQNYEITALRINEGQIDGLDSGDDAIAHFSVILDGLQNDAEIFDYFDDIAKTHALISVDWEIDYKSLMQIYEAAEKIMPPFRVIDLKRIGAFLDNTQEASDLIAMASWLDLEFSSIQKSSQRIALMKAIYDKLTYRLIDKNIRVMASLERVFQDIPKSSFSADEALQSLHQLEKSDMHQGSLSKIDPYIYQHKVRDLMSAPPVIVDAGMPLLDAMVLMVDRKISSVFVRNAGHSTPRKNANAGTSDQSSKPLLFHLAGIVTEKDILFNLAQKGGDALTMPVAQFQSRPLIGVRDSALVYRAVGRMSTTNIRHLAVADANDAVVGLVSARDLLRLRASEAISLGDEIDNALHAPALASAWSRLPKVVSALIAEDIDILTISDIISRELGALTRRAAILAENQMQDEGYGDAPAPFAVMMLGSAGRGESLLSVEQDNGLIYDDSELKANNAKNSAQWFERFAIIMNDILHQAGIAYCRDNIMARDGHWRGSVTQWKKRIQSWTSRSRADDVVNLDLFFDLRSVYGVRDLVSQLAHYAYDQVYKAPHFIKLLAQNSEMTIEPFSMFGTLRTQEGALDIKQYGLFPLTSMARLLCLRFNLYENSTKARLEILCKKKILSQDDMESYIQHYSELSFFMIKQQLHDLQRGLPARSQINMHLLNKYEKRVIRKALRHILNVDILVYDFIFA